MASLSLPEPLLHDLIWSAMQADRLDATDPRHEADMSRLAALLRPAVDQALTPISEAMAYGEETSASALAIASEALSAAAPELSALPIHLRIAVIDDFASALALSAPPRNPAAWLRANAARSSNGTFQPRSQRTTIKPEQNADHAQRSQRFSRRHGKTFSPSVIAPALHAMAEGVTATQFHPLVAAAFRDFLRNATIAA